jgi:phosphomannomutase
MLNADAPLAGEMSGHIFFGDGWYGFDDALYAAVRLIRAIHLSGRSLTELRDAMPGSAATPDLRIPVAEARKRAVVAEVAARVAAAGGPVDTTDGVRVRDGEGWWLLRVSNTQAAVTVRAESRDQADLERILKVVRAQLLESGVHL